MTDSPVSESPVSESSLSESSVSELPIVRSYALDDWLDAADGGPQLRNPSTGEVSARISATPVDTGAMVRHAREVGGPALRALTFHQRALLLKKLAAYLTEHTDEIYARYDSVGATLADARVDVEGGIQTLQYYAGVGLKELPGTRSYPVGSPEKLGKNFRGQVVYTSKHGVAALIGAYNFPVWGFLEKLGPTILAGLPVIVKPASPTGHIAEAAFAAIVESGVFPAGVVQLISGGARDLLDHLGGQDVIAFTGSGATAATLRSHPAVTERGCQLNAETDSLNATVLGPDVTPDSPLFGTFVKSVMREMTSKSGQKCTAIRRILVPAEHVGPVVDGLRAALGKVVLGDPSVEGTTMGPVISREQADAVRGVIETLAAEADIVIGGTDTPHVASGNAESGAFLAPTVLVARDGAQQVHEVEPFGPVATLVPVRDLADAARVANLGEGSLVASLVTNSPEAVAEFVDNAGAFHGRILVLDEHCAATAMPHGAVLPQSIHGGPGRAGGGEELAGVRGIVHLMQATSLTGSPQMLMEYTQTWNDGVEPMTADEHPFRKYLDDLPLGYTLFTEGRTVTQEDVEHFAHFTGDVFYAHMDEEAASASPIFGGRVAHGYLILAFAAGLFVDAAPGPVLANFGLEHLRFVKPLYFGDTMRMRLTAKHKTERPGAGWGEVVWDCQVWNQDDEVVATYELLTINAARPKG